MVYAFSHDFSVYDEHLQNHGRRVAEEHCKHFEKGLKTQGETNMRYQGYCDTCGYSEDSCQPKMNYLYPLVLNNFTDEAILSVVEKTNCTVLENEEDCTWYLALCGGGMDLSQDIAYAYHLLETWIPYDLCISVCTQPELSIRGKDWDALRSAVIKSLTNHKGHLLWSLEKWQHAQRTPREAIR